jgi:sugar O-acyltransferase (sialic acid O-acetyltransferase NeuD family)
MLPKRRLFIFGAGGHTKQVIDIFKLRKIRIHGLFDDYKNKDETYYHDYKILDTIDNAKRYLNKYDVLFCGIGDNKIREQIFKEFKEFTFANCISPFAIVSKSAKLGQGNYIGNFTNVMPDSIVGSHNIINDSSMIGHDAELGDFNLVAAYVCCGAYSKIGNSNLLGINVSVNPTRIRIGNDNVIGSGTVVINDINDGNVVIGIPGKPKYSVINENFECFE